MRPITNEHEWNELVQRFNGHPLQLWGWGDVKSAHGWSVERVAVENAHDGREVIGGAQLLIRRLPWPFRSLVYVPRGPFGNGQYEQALVDELAAYAKKHHGAVALSVEPDRTDVQLWRGWHRSSNRVLLARTAVLDLTKPEDELLAVMSKKTRQYIRKSAGEGIEVVTAQTLSDVDACLEIYKQTAQRAGFALHNDQYYHDIFTNLKDASPVFMAKHSGEVVAFLWPIVTPEVAFELYGGMNDTGQQLRANFHLKWSVIQEMQRRGVKRYDVNGLLNDGVTAFKKGFIPDETQMCGTFDKPLSPLYPIWSVLLPAVKRALQRLRR